MLRDVVWLAGVPIFVIILLHLSGLSIKTEPRQAD